MRTAESHKGEGNKFECTSINVFLEDAERFALAVSCRFLVRAVAGREARAFGLGLLAIYGVEGVELFPKQNELTDGPGSLIQMSFGVHRLTGHCYDFYTADGAPLAPTTRERIYALKTPDHPRGRV